MKSLMAGRLPILVAGCLALSACVPATGGAGKPPLAKAVLANGAVTVAGPEGYCLDPATLSRGPSSDFALIASCWALSGGKVGFWVEPVVVTVAVGPPGSETDLPTPEGIASTAGAGLLMQGSERGLMTANLDRGGEGKLEGGDPRHWRGAFALNGRLVMLALYAPQGSEYTGLSGGRMLSMVRDQVTALSGKSGEAEVVPAETVVKKKKKTGLFAGLFDKKDLP